MPSVPQTPANAETDFCHSVNTTGGESFHFTAFSRASHISDEIQGHQERGKKNKKLRPK
jgi:hypothetical protein